MKSSLYTCIQDIQNGDREQALALLEKFSPLLKKYVEEDGDSGHYTLTKDGIPWVGTPGTDQFGDICFSDGRNLYIQCFLSYNDTLSTDFRWFCVNFNHFDDEDSHFLPDETMNKLFTGADGETLYTDDGYQYKLSTMPWCQDGTCKR